jgi:virulence-associated protein VagC
VTNLDAPPPGEIQIGFQALRFGQQIRFEEEDVPVLADEGDVLCIFPHGNGMSSVLVLTPEQALRTAEALARTAKKGSDMARKFMEENDG